MTELTNYQERLEIEISKLWCLPQENKDEAEHRANKLYSILLRITAQIMEIKRGEIAMVDELKLAQTASKYYQKKLKNTEGFEKRCEIIETANFWTRLYMKMKGK